MQYVLGNMLNGGGINPDGLSLDLQFAADKTLTARRGPTPAFTRGSTGTFVGSNGLIQSAAVNIPRFDHDPVTLACKGLLIEEGRTNLCLQSNAFSTSPWDNLSSVCAISQNQTGPDGIANSAWTFTDDNTASIEGRYSTASLTGGVVYSLSVFVKKTTGTPSTYPAIWFARGGTLGGCVINTTAGTATAITSFSSLTIISTTASVVDSGNFWRVTSLITPNVTGSWEMSISPSGNGNGTGVLDSTATGSAVFWGAQLEAGSSPTSYIPTTTGSVVRSADVCSITGGDFTSFYNQSEGTMFAECQTPSANQYAGIAVIGTTSFNHNIALFKSNTTGETAGNRFRPYVTQAGSLVAMHDFGNESGNGNLKVLASVALNNMIFARNGTLSPLDSTAAMPTPNRITIGGRADGNYINGHIAALRYYKKRLPDAKLVTLTT